MATITAIGTATASTANNATVAITLTAAVAAGQAIIVSVAQGGSRAVSSISDGTANVYVKGAGVASGTQAASEIWHCLNPANALSIGATITVTLNGSDTRKSIMAWKLGGVGTQTTSGSAAGNSATPSATTSGSAGASDAVFAVVACAAADASFTQDPDGWTEDYSADNNSRRQSHVRQVVGSAGAVTYNPTFSSGKNWSVAVSAYSTPAAGKPTHFKHYQQLRRAA